MQENNFLTPFTLPNGIQLKNRILMAPMTTCSGFHDGSVTQDMLAYYAKRAGEVAAIIVECGYIDKRGLAFAGAIGLDEDDKIEGLSKIANAIKEKGSKAIIQIYHGGRMVDPKLIGGNLPVAPSAIAAPRPNAPFPFALSADEITLLIGKFAQGIKRAILAGFDGIEIHGANTYLIQQFYSPNSNQRHDEWGGDRNKRAKFPLAIVDAALEMRKKYADDDFIIGYRFSPEELEEPGIRFEDTLYLLEKIAERKIDYLHFSMGATLRSSIVDKQDKTPLIQKYINLRSKNLANIPVIGVGNIINQTDASQALEQGYDLVAVGRALIAYPDWLTRTTNDEYLDLKIADNQREALVIPEPLWRFPLVESLIYEANPCAPKYKEGIFQTTVADETNEFVIDVNLGKDFIKNIELVNAETLDSKIIENFTFIKQQVLTTNSPHVDVIAGATTQCEAFKKAIVKALNHSSQAAVIDAGGDIHNQHYDILVIGSGGAGLTAAIQAYDLGYSVTIIEQMSIIGGNTIKASAGMNAAETNVQKSLNIQDSKQQFYLETLKAGKQQNNPDLLHFLTDHADKALNWLTEKGIELTNITTTGGMQIDRTHRPNNGRAIGGYLVSGLVKQINQRNIDIKLETQVVEIVYQANQIVGVKVKQENEQPFLIHCNAVIVATGGFGANYEMVKQFRPELCHFITTNHKGALGSGIQLLAELGAGTVDMAEIQIHPTVQQQSRYLISESVRGSGAILVSPTGKRFVNELDTRDNVSSHIRQLPEQFAYIIFDEHIRKDNKSIEEYIAQGFVIEAKMLSELAKILNINDDILNQTVAVYNQSVIAQFDGEFNRITGLRHQLNHAPFYAIQVAPGIHHTMGGVTINPNAQVLNTQGEIIDGVFAAGEVVGGIHGANRIGGNAVADIIVFGIQAGKNAAAYLQNMTKKKLA